jgi:DNA-binding transcriptional regulator YiaG
VTPQEFKEARRKLGLTLSELAAILNVDSRTIRRWEAEESVETSRPPNPVAVRVMEWMLDGYRPPQWPASTS